MPLGTTGHWLTSEAFDLATDRGSPEAEEAVLKAKEVLREPEPGLDAVMKAHDGLRRTLPELDPFWVRSIRFRGAVRRRAVIRVAPAMEPAQFDERVRKPGLASIAQLAARQAPKTPFRLASSSPTGVVRSTTCWRATTASAPT